jgi:DNA sulfur modification protein DndD
MESDYVQYKELRITNFKRFAGTHVLPLMGEGNVTIIAAKNGVGKTTVLDAFNLVLHGSQGIKKRFSKKGFKFEEWIRKTHNTTIMDEDCQVGVQLTLIDPTIGEVMIKRDYWFEREGGSVDMELTVRINGKPLSLEKGESKHNMAQRWIEAFIPLAVSQRFLFDGEKLPDLNVSELNEEFREGLDDILGQQAIQQLNFHLNSIMKATTKQMTPEDDQKALDDWFKDLDEARLEEISLTDKIAITSKDLEKCTEKANSLQSMIVSKGKEEGESLGEVRAKQAVAASNLAGRRKELIRVISESLPFIIAGVPGEINEWGIIEAKETIENNLVANSTREILDKILARLNPELSKPDVKRMKVAMDDELASNENDVSEIFQFLNKDDIDSIMTNHALLKQDIEEDASIAISDAILAFDNHEKTTIDMLAESEKLGLVEIALEYKEVSTRIGMLRGEVESIKGALSKTQTFISETEEQILNMQSLSQQDSKLNKRLELILVIRKIILEYAAQRRNSLSKPLERGFSEGFKLLSRKAKSVKNVQISASDYSPLITMDGYDGNWLERDLSATEKQHVGLSMLYAICKLSRTALPVVVDTPVSRMDKEHKGWSVTKFYPKLSHQVIVLTTSDDLSNGLFDELKEANCIGSQILLEETGPATAKAVIKTLEEFF